MKQKKWINRLLSVGLILVYVVTFLVAIKRETPIMWMDLIATVGVAIGVAVLFSGLPILLYGAILLFTVLAQYFGMMLGFYDTLWWYDLAVHFLSGFLLASLGQYFFVFLTRKTQLALPITLTVWFSVFFAIASAGLWEIYEYCADTFFGLASQQGMGQTEIQDTMQDIIAGSISGGLYGIGLGYFLSRRRKKELSSALSGEGGDSLR